MARRKKKRAAPAPSWSIRFSEDLRTTLGMLADLLNRGMRISEPMTPQKVLKEIVEGSVEHYLKLAEQLERLIAEKRKERRDDGLEHFILKSCISCGMLHRGHHDECDLRTVVRHVRRAA